MPVSQVVPSLSPAIARRWLADGRAGHARVDGSVLFADISGFTRLSERLARRGRAGAEEVVRIVSSVMTGLVAEIELRGGDILVFAGDALVVLYEGDSAAERAVLSAAAIRRAFATQDAVATSAGRAVLRVSVGVASGPVDLVLAGADEAALFAAGPTMSEMVRLERAAAASEVLLCRQTAGAVPAAWSGEERDGARLLARSVPLPAAEAARARESEPNETRLIPVPVRPLLEAGPLGLDSDHRLATVAFALASGLDARLADGPEAVARDLDELYRTAAQAAAVHRVTLLGPDVAPDGVALFLAAGAPVATGSDEERMLRTLRDLLDTPVARRLALRAGTNRGPVFAGFVGAPHRGTYTAMGDTTNLAARVAARANPGELLATADVVARSAMQFETEPGDPFQPKGKRGLVVPYRVGAAHRRQARTPSRLALAGREAELARLREGVAAALAGRGSVVEVRGGAGVGKSRLVAELLADPSIAGRFEIRFSAGDEATPYAGLRPAVRELAGLPEQGARVPSDEADEAERLRSWVAPLAPGVLPWLPLLAIPFGVAVPESPEVAGLAPAYRRARLHDAVTSVLGAALGPGTVLVIEDLHWSDEASFALLEALAREAGSRGWLVVALTRPTAEPFAAPDAAVIELAGLDPDAVTRLAIDAAGATPLSDAELDAIISRAGGVPLFVRELAAVAAEHGGVETLPDRLESLLASRIDRLDGRHRALLRRAAVLGRTVELELLSAVLPGEPLVTDLGAWAALDEFVGWLDPGRLQFRHDLYRDAAYAGLAVETRRELHAGLAAAIERRPGADLDELAATLAIHHAQAGSHEPAFRYASRAGDLARSRYANIDAAALYQRALASGTLAGSVAPSMLATVAESLGDVAELAGHYDEALDAYRRARALGRAQRGASNPVEAARVARKSGIVCERAAQYRQALGWYTRGRRLLAGAGSPDAEQLRIRLDLDAAGIRFRQGRYGACVAGALAAAAAAERAGERALLAHAYYLLHAAYGDLGSPEVARYRHLALPIYEELGDLVGQGNVLNNLGIEAYFEGRWGDALDLYARSKAAKTRAGDVANAATQSNNEAEILSDQGHFAEAEALLRDALRVWGAAGYEIGIALATSNLGRAAARAGRHEEGLVTLEAAAARFERMGAAGYVDETRARIAECLALAGRADEAKTVALETLARVRREAETSVLEAQLERTLGWCALAAADASTAQAHLNRSAAVARELAADFELALTLRARHHLPDLGAEERATTATEAERVLAGLGVVVVAEPPLPSRQADTGVAVTAR